MNTQGRRYIFIDFENLLQVKFKKLEKVATRIFVFVNAQEESVPLQLARQMQPFGKNLRWIVVSNSSNSKLNYHIAFIMGKLHQKLDMGVEFAVVSHDMDFDPLISFINQTGRSCLRVKRKKDEGSIYQPELGGQEDFSGVEDNSLRPFSNSGDIDVLVEDEIIARTAEETVKRLIRSGNRPQEVATLKNYILLHSQELSLHGNVDRIIQQMKDTKDIDIHKGEIIYNF
ncbi:MAG: PIN domain-containing protein [Saprospiraceae bacterium]